MHLAQRWSIFVATAIAAIACALAVENIDPAGDGSQYAYGENIGWINAEPSGQGGPGMEVTDRRVLGWLWAENVGWINLACTTPGCPGVSNDISGRLSGYAWNENTGWINFRPNGVPVTIDRPTGLVTGRAWGENIGWITFSASSPVAYGVKTSWCQPAPAAPARPSLSVRKVGSVVRVELSGVSGTFYIDLVEGELGLLRSSRGNFSTATTACLADNDPATSYPSTRNPSAGDGLWYLARSLNCGGTLGYEEGSSSQIGLRDPEIALAAATCP